MRIGNRLFPYPLLNHERLYSHYKEKTFDLLFNGYIEEKKNYVLENIRISTTSSFIKVYTPSVSVGVTSKDK